MRGFSQETVVNAQPQIASDLDLYCFLREHGGSGIGEIGGGSLCHELTPSSERE